MCQSTKTLISGIDILNPPTILSIEQVFGAFATNEMFSKFLAIANSNLSKRLMQLHSVDEELPDKVKARYCPIDIVDFYYWIIIILECSCYGKAPSHILANLE